MITPVHSIKEVTPSFSAIKLDEEELKKRPIVVKNTFLNRMEIGWDKFTNAITMYPARGLKGSRNSNFYEYLTMGVIPYIAGSLTLMAVFQGPNKAYETRATASAKKFGNKMALGVLFYGLAKSISKSFVTTPVRWITGVDTEEPYAEIKYKLPEHKNDGAITSLEYHKVLESLEFPRWDVKYGDESKGEPRNIWFDEIAKKIGLGSDLKDSDQEVKPRVKEIAVKTNLAKSISSYIWAAVGVGLAVQNTWDEFFKVANFKFWDFKPFLYSLGKFADCLGNSAIRLYKGNSTSKGFWPKHSGKVLLSVAALSSIIGVWNAVTSHSKPSKVAPADIIEKDRKYVVN